jgi:hypothetical protein
MSEYTDQLLTERRVNLARIAELESALRTCERLLNDPDAEAEDADKVSVIIRNALKGTK